MVFVAPAPLIVRVTVSVIVSVSVSVTTSVTVLVDVTVTVPGEPVEVGAPALVETFDEEADEEGVSAPVPQVPGAVIVSSIMVTAAVSANRPPWHETPELAVMDASAMMVPTNEVLVPRVAELPTCQKTLQAWAPLIRTTEAAVAVVMVEPNWKTKRLLALFWPSSVSFPVRPPEEAKLYTPGPRVIPPRSWPVRTVVGVRAANSV